MAKRWGATLHVLHAIELSVTAWANVVDVDDATRQIENQLSTLNLKDVVTNVSIISDSPAYAILEYVESREIQLVVMGTVGRTGIPGMFVGNTAEKVMPLLPCSILAIKPPGFKSPVLLKSDESEEGS